MDRSTDICVIGGGPAGSTLATRLAHFGWKVVLVERAVFPRRKLGECLTPGVRPLLSTIGVGAVMERAGFPRVRKVTVRWDVEREREDPAGHGMLVDRGHFDSLLLEHARSCGVCVLQPARVEKMERIAGRWKVLVRAEPGMMQLEARFVADASGRAGVLRGRRRPSGPRTLALHAYWSGPGLPAQPRIEAGTDGWFWGVPLPDGFYNTLVFVDPRDLRARAGALEGKFRELLAASSLLPAEVNARVVGKVQVVDSTPYLEEESVTEDSIRVGDAALALDPLSSSGVQKAIQTSLAGAVVVNTLLRRPEAGQLARQFYSESLAAASAQHRAWAQGHYARVAAGRATRFWRERSSDVTHAEAAPAPPEVAMTSDRPWRLSPDAQIVDAPCIVETFVETRAAVSSPALGTPVAYLGAWELVPLLRSIRSGMTLRELVGTWRPLVSPRNGMAIAQWMVSHRLLVACANGAGAVDGRAG